MTKRRPEHGMSVAGHRSCQHAPWRGCCQPTGASRNVCMTCMQQISLHAQNAPMQAPSMQPCAHPTYPPAQATSTLPYIHTHIHPCTHPTRMRPLKGWPHAVTKYRMLFVFISISTHDPPQQHLPTRLLQRDIAVRVELVADVAELAAALVAVGVCITGGCRCRLRHEEGRDVQRDVKGRPLGARAGAGGTGPGGGRRTGPHAGAAAGAKV